MMVDFINSSLSDKQGKNHGKAIWIFLMVAALLGTVGLVIYCKLCKKTDKTFAQGKKANETDVEAETPLDPQSVVVREATSS
jgi:flagellar basal body-associated protein FliL